MKACNSCGKCCIKYSNGGLSASQADIEQWQASRPDISHYVYKGNIWVDPDTQKTIELCPWLREEKSLNSKHVRYTCAIYNNRPEDCRIYPATIEDMVKDECEMLEAKDLKSSTRQAQKALDAIMNLNRD
ncbi:MAG: YkgJ family cysteine cluster protein [Arenicella sp.]